MKTHNTIAKDLLRDNRSVPQKLVFGAVEMHQRSFFYSNCSRNRFLWASKVGVLPYSKSALRRRRRTREPAQNIANRIF